MPEKGSNSYLQQLVYQNAGLVKHSNIERTPVFVKRKVEEPIVDREVVVGRAFMW